MDGILIRGRNTLLSGLLMVCLTAIAVPATADAIVLDGNDNPNCFGPFSSNDTLRGFGSWDKLEGGNGDDIINGGNGNDSGSHTACGWSSGGGGLPVNENYFLSGDDGNDIVYGGDGGDWLYGRSGADDLYGQEGNDTIYANGDNTRDEVYGNAGFDVCYITSVDVEYGCEATPSP